MQPLGLPGGVMAGAAVDPREAILEVRNLRTSFPTGRGFVHAVDNVSFNVRKGEALALVGESGCGKSVTAMSIMRLVAPPGRITAGEVFFKGRNLADLSEREMRNVRGNDIAMVFQEPMTSLNPVFKIGAQVAEAVRIHNKVSKKEAWKRAGDMLELVSIPDPIKRLDDYPHQLSGGMRQRVMIAMALSCDPELLIADEPTTALDVTIQAQIMELLESLQRRLGLAILPHHARPRRRRRILRARRRDVHRAHRRRVARSRSLREPRPPVHPRASQVAAERERRRPICAASPANDQRDGPADHEPAAWLQVQPALPRRHGYLPRQRTGSDDRCAGT